LLSELRVTDGAFAEIVADLKRRYIAPLMHVLSRARTSGELRNDVPLSLMRDMGYVTSGRKPNVQQTAPQLCDLLWSAFAQPRDIVKSLMRFRTAVVGALRFLETTASGTGLN
jgi:hypothetical protein